MMNNYGTPPLALVRGNGAEVWDEDGRRYLDLLGGIAVNALGHAHPAVVEAVTRQISTLGHTSNLYITEPPLALAERLLELLGTAGPGAVLQLGRRGQRGRVQDGPAAPAVRTIIAAEDAFHGRTMGALALTGQPSKRTPFEPLTPGRVARALRRRRRAGRRRRRRHRRGLPRTDHGGGGRRHPARRATSRRRGRSPRSAARCSCSTRCRPASGAPAPGSPTRASASCRTSSRWPRASAAGCPSGRASASAPRPSCSSPASTAPRSAATRSAAPRRWPCSTRSPPTGCWSTPRSSARASPPASRSWGTRWSAASTAPAC